jgi:PAS domain S-box-containing protein
MDITTRGIIFEGRSARLVLAIDVTEQVEALEDLKATENLYRGLVEHSMVGLYVVKDGKLAYANPRLAEMFGYAPEQMQDMDILELAVPEQRDAMVAAIHARLSGSAATGRDVFSGRRRDGSEIIIDVHSARIGARGEPLMMGVVLDVTAAKRAEAKAQEHVEHLQRVLDDTLRAISALGEIRDAYTAGHETRVGRLAAALGAELGITSSEQNALRMAGQVHDAGKIGIPAEILSKPSRLSALEYDLVKTHPQLGYDVVKFIDFRQPVAEIVLQHHERIDGSGYPRGLNAETMLPLAKILAIADVVEAMHSHRPYRVGLGIDSALDEIEKNTGRLYDAGVSAACVRLFRQRGYRIH